MLLPGNVNFYFHSQQKGRRNEEELYYYCGILILPNTSFLMECIHICNAVSLLCVLCNCSSATQVCLHLRR